MTSSSELLVPRGTLLRARSAAAARPAALEALQQPMRPGDAAAVDPRLLASAREAARRDGYAEGHRQGVAAAADEAGQAERERDATVERALGAIGASVEALARHQAAELARVEDELAAVALALAEAILGRELELAAAPGREALARAIALAGEPQPAVARLNPADIATLGAVDELVADRQLTVVADPAVEPGGCVLDAGATRVDARLATALQRVREVLGA